MTAKLKKVANFYVPTWLIVTGPVTYRMVQNFDGGKF